MLHRYFAMGVGFLIIVINAWAWLRRQQVGSRIASISSFILLHYRDWETDRKIVV